MDRRKTLLIEHLSKEVQVFFDVLNGEKDLPAILMAASYIDASLASILKRKLREISVSDRLLDTNSRSGSISSRADLFFSLGLIEKRLYQDLILISRIRDKVAHHQNELDFTASSITKLCNELGYVASLNNGNSIESLGLGGWMEEARDQFIITAIMASQRLLLVCPGVSEQDNSVLP
jgi:DNA-binding MltR family transcriptional regulator